jgi:hypothetical protein
MSKKLVITEKKKESHGSLKLTYRVKSTVLSRLMNYSKQVLDLGV